MKEVKAKYAVLPRIERKPWGAVDGQAVSLYKLTNSHGLEMHVTDYGAIIQSLYVYDRMGNLGDVVLGYDCLEDYVRDTYYLGCVVGRYANRIAGGTVQLDGQHFTIHTREGGYHLHGGRVGFNKKVWSVELLEKEEASGIRLSYLSADGEEGFPGNLLTVVTYWLTNRNNVIVEYDASTDKTTLVNLTQHSYFNLAGHDAGDILDHEIQIPSRWYLPVNGMQVPRGEIAAVEGTPFDFRRPKRIGLDIHKQDLQLELSAGYDHSWVLEKEHTPELKHAATVQEQGSGRVLGVYTTEPAVHFYSANFIDGGTIGKRGAIYDRRNSLCLETQHFPDAPNNPHFPSTVLRPEERFHSKTIFQFSVAS